MNDETDVCIVGAGAGGAALAKELVEAGLSVVILEVGERPDRTKIPTGRPDWELHTRDFTPGNPARDRVVRAPGCDPRFRVGRFKGVGGSTMHYEAFLTRHHPDDYRRRTKLGLGADWPLGYRDLAGDLDRVEGILGISGTLDNPFEPPRSAYPNPAIRMSCAVARVAEGARKTGLHPCHAPLGILPRPAPGRGGCNFCGGCWYGCAMSALSNAAQTYLPIAERGGAEIRTGSMATRVVVASSGKAVRGVEYLDASGALHLQPAKVVALCGNAVETARLLLMSSGAGHADGLANSSGLVGTHFSSHTIVALGALLDERVDAYKGPNINGMVQDFYDHDDQRPFAGGYVIALRNAEAGPLTFRQHWLDRNLFGAELLDAMAERFGHTVTVSAYGEHFATPEDRVTLDPDVKDTYGLPVPRVAIARRANEHAMLEHMQSTLHDILAAAGGKSIRVTYAPGLIGTHLMGTCRMGEDPKSSVTDPYGRTHDLENLYVADGSLFPTSTPGNPTLTLYALATRVARRIAARARGNG